MLSSGQNDERLLLLRVCEDKKVDIIWRYEAKTAADDVGVSKDFWEYAKELKKKKQLEAAAEVNSGGSK
jgi:hypothetical protein